MKILNSNQTNKYSISHCDKLKFIDVTQARDYGI